MARKAFTFGIRLRDKERTLKLRQDPKKPRRYVVEDSRRGSATKQREHGSLGSAIRDAATTWRSRLH
jgi:hypothetical protein